MADGRRVEIEIAWRTSAALSYRPMLDDLAKLLEAKEPTATSRRWVDRRWALGHQADAGRSRPAIFIAGLDEAAIHRRLDEVGVITIGAGVTYTDAS
jgi:xanthine dehydrogenase iron-sulfur cluster and FAD-binding subunit A